MGHGLFVRFNRGHLAQEESLEGLGLVILGLAIATASDHLEVIAELANIFNDSTAIEDLAAATTPSEVQGILGVAS